MHFTDVSIARASASSSFLVMAFLSWRRDEGSIYHPILLQRLQLQFNAAVPEFALSEADHPVELYLLCPFPIDGPMWMDVRSGVAVKS